VRVEYRPADLDDVRRIRHLVLRPHQRPDELAIDGASDPEALHLGAFEDGELVGVSSISREPPPGSSDANAWRVRGMAVLPGRRDRGIGTELLRRCVAHAVERGATLVWCNGRVPARRFYERHGFVVVRGPWDEPHIGPHVEMHLRPSGVRG
jgi:GNAT superfamily N-acetyltransferase